MLTLNNGLTFSDIDLWSLKTALNNAQAPAPAPTPAPAPAPAPSPSGTLVLPADFAGLAPVHGVLPWKTWSGTANRQYAELNGGQVLLWRFVTGAPSARAARLAGAEWGGGPIQHTATLIRERDSVEIFPKTDTGVVQGRIVSTTITMHLLVGQPDTPWVYNLEPNTAYTVAIRNVANGQTGQMFMDLYI